MTSGETVMRFVFFLSFLSAELTAATVELSRLPLLCSLADDGSRAQNVFAHLHRHCEADSKNRASKLKNPFWSLVKTQRGQSSINAGFRQNKLHLLAV